jgi:hypothetical protein
LCSDLGCSNLADIQAALSISSRVFVDLPVFRNFFAHRNERSIEAAVRLGPLHGIPATLRPAAILLSPPLNSAQPLLVNWLEDMSFVVEYMCS